ncbi:uncharacterized protein LOC113770350 [Coffea eugenioides]|uniref:uncharacterized protein LOC113770350 n=1 Tax=Coffea eugenioides TaxID=49369 RepID=UPI000F6097C3|nr:uncharacterized protein LOC113770350 [Coffea eugenioides]
MVLENLLKFLMTHSTITEDIPVSTYFVPLTYDIDISQHPNEPITSPKSPSLLTYHRRNNRPTAVPDNGEALSHFGWCQAMMNEMAALDSNATWELVPLLLDKSAGEPLKDSGKYQRLVGRLNYLTVTQPNISFPVSVISEFLDSPSDTHWNATIRILRYIEGAPGQGLLYTDRGNMQVIGYSNTNWAGSPIDRHSIIGYCILVGGNLISFKSKKQAVTTRFSAENEYQAMAMATYELIWLKQLLNKLNLGTHGLMKLVYDNQFALHIASNPVFHERKAN